MVRGTVGSRPGSPGVHRRDLGLDEHGSHPWQGTARRAPASRHPARPLEDHDLRRWPAQQRHGGTHGARRTDQRHRLPGLRRSGADPRPAAWRHRRHGQSRQPQEAEHPRRHRGCRRTPALPAALQPGLQPDRECLRQAQGHAAQGRRAIHRRPLVPPSAKSSTPSIQPNAPTTSPPQATTQHDRKML